MYHKGYVTHILLSYRISNVSSRIRSMQKYDKGFTQGNLEFEGPDITFTNCFNNSKNHCFRNSHTYTESSCFSYLPILSNWFYFEHLTRRIYA